MFTTHLDYLSTILHLLTEYSTNYHLNILYETIMIQIIDIYSNFIRVYHFIIIFHWIFNFCQKFLLIPILQRGRACNTDEEAVLSCHHPTTGQHNLVHQALAQQNSCRR